MDNFEHHWRLDSFAPRSQQSGFLHRHHTVFQCLGPILMQRCQHDCKIAVGHPPDLSGALPKFEIPPCSSQACPAEAGRLIFRAVKKSERPEIPRKTIYRLSIYLRCLARLHENGIGTVSSEALAKAAGVKPTQLRKDLAYFGTFGTRGLGYDVAELSRRSPMNSARRACSRSSWSASATSASRCSRIADLKRKGLKSSPPLTPSRSASATRKSSSRFRHGGAAGICRASTA